MEKTDILRDMLCIERIFAVVKGAIPRKNKLITVNGRRSDAFVLVLSGSCTYRFSDKTTFTATEGDVFYLPHQSAYTMQIRSHVYTFLFCDFGFTAQSDRRAFLHPAQSGRSSEPLFRKLLLTYQSAQGGKQAECMSLLYAIYGILQRDAHPTDPEKRNDIVASTRHYLEEHFADATLSISGIADRAGISEVYLRRLFKEHYHVSPIQYLTALRLAHAKSLMKYSFLTLEECATQSGFSSLQYFCRVFKKEMGIPPGVYRKTT